MDSVPFSPTDNTSFFDYFSQFNSTDFAKQITETPAIPYLTALASGALGISAFNDFAALKCVKPSTVVKTSIAALCAAYTYTMVESKEVALAFAIGGAAWAMASKVREYESDLGKSQRSIKKQKNIVKTKDKTIKELKENQENERKMNEKNYDTVTASVLKFCEDERAKNGRPVENPAGADLD